MGLLHLKTGLHSIPQQAWGDMSVEGRSNYFQFLLLRCLQATWHGFEIFSMKDIWSWNCQVKKYVHFNILIATVKLSSKKTFSMHLATINRYTVALSPADLGIINLFIVLRLLQVNGAKNALSLM